nr:MAG TPA: hypothetical protein [Caudoviricetes sp.]
MNNEDRQRNGGVSHRPAMESHGGATQGNGTDSTDMNRSGNALQCLDGNGMETLRFAMALLGTECIATEQMGDDMSSNGTALNSPAMQWHYIEMSRFATDEN